MTRLRGRKIVRDLWINRTRSLLTIIAMTVGMIGLSAVLCAYSILVRELDANYLRTNPASAVIVTESVDEHLLAGLRTFSGIGSVEARGFFSVRVMVGENEWRPLLLFVVDDFEKMRIGTSRHEEGQWPPTTGNILIERAAMRVARKNIGDTVLVRFPGARERELRISGTAHDPAQPPAWMEGLVYGYVSRDTLSLFGKNTLNEVLVTVADKPFDKTYIRTTVKSITSWMEQQGHPIQRIDIPEPGHHPHQTQLTALLFLLQAFGGLSFVLSGVLVVTLIGAIMAQQVRQIGVMKAIGARTSQMATMYLSGVLVLAAIAVIVGLPSGVLMARGYARFAANMLNFEIADPSVPFWTYAVLVFVGLTIPMVSALFPIYRGSRVSVREAITDYGIPAWRSTNGTIDRLSTTFPRISRPFLLSLRNTFRRRGRIALILATLAIGGAMFITALDTGASITKTIRTFRNVMRYDLKVSLSRPAPSGAVETILENVAGVTGVEGWGQAKASLVYPDGADGNQFALMAPPPGTDLLRPHIVSGRWLTANDRNALVVNHIFMFQEPHLKTGDEVVLRVGAVRTTWRIVGVIRQIGPPTAFTNRDYLESLTNEKGLVRTLAVVTKERSPAAHLSVSREIEGRLAATGYSIQDLVSIDDIQKILEDHFVVLTTLLLVMSILIVIVGGLGLSTTISIQVIERTRETGVMRAIGASSSAIFRMVCTEGLVIGILSWLLAVCLALPVSKYVGDLFGMIFLRTTLDFAVSPIAFLLWLGIVVGFSLLASFFPARRAARLTVRDTLSYE